MIYGIYALHDVKAGNYAQPFYTPNRPTAIRHFMAATDDPNSLVSKFPQDFRLFEIGQFDDVTGVLTAPPNPILIAPNQE